MIESTKEKKRYPFRIFKIENDFSAPIVWHNAIETVITKVNVPEANKLIRRMLWNMLYTVSTALYQRDDGKELCIPFVDIKRQLIKHPNKTIQEALFKAFKLAKNKVFKVKYQRAFSGWFQAKYTPFIPTTPNTYKGKYWTLRNRQILLSYLSSIQHTTTQHSHTNHTDTNIFTCRINPNICRTHVCQQPYTHIPAAAACPHASSHMLVVPLRNLTLSNQCVNFKYHKQLTELFTRDMIELAYVKYEDLYDRKPNNVKNNLNKRIELYNRMKDVVINNVSYITSQLRIDTDIFKNRFETYTGLKLTDEQTVLLKYATAGSRYKLILLQDSIYQTCKDNLMPPNKSSKALGMIHDFFFRNYAKRNRGTLRETNWYNKSPKIMRDCIVPKDITVKKVEMDISNSQPCIALSWILENKIKIEPWIKESITDGSFYELMYNSSKLLQKYKNEDGLKAYGKIPHKVKIIKSLFMVKKEYGYIAKQFYFKKPKSTMETYKEVDKIAPLFMEALRVMENQVGSLSTYLQNREAEIVLTFANKIQGLSVHDSIVFLSKSEEETNRILEDFKTYISNKLKVNVNIKI